MSRESWDRRESRVEASVDQLLGLLEQHGATATFFVLGWTAERHRDLVRGIAAGGHEIASHGHDHRRVTELTAAEFRESVRRSKHTLEEITGSEVIGFRAPSFSIVKGTEWALDILVEQGYKYDSSLFPVRRNRYGYANGKRGPHWLNRPGGRLLELPPTTLRRLGQNLPAAGGAYFRLFPYGVTRRAFQDAELDGVLGTFYVHPWEVDPDQPRLPVSPFTRVRHYGGLGRTLPRLDRLLSEFGFTSIATTFCAYAGRG